MQLILESTILHEIVHWARDQKSSLPVQHSHGTKKHEVGKFFECAAYGGDMTLLEQGLSIMKKDLKGRDDYDSFTCKSKTDTRIQAILKQASSGGGTKAVSKTKSGH